MAIVKEQSARDVEFWRSHNGVALVWSNPQASDDVMIANALLHPSFHLLLDIAARFGIDRLESRWKSLRDSISCAGAVDRVAQIARARPIVERSLANMRAALRT